MAENIKIQIEFRVDRGFVYPEHIRVPVNTRIEWEIIDLNVNQSSRQFFETGLTFELYFQNRSPFRWRRESVGFEYPRPTNTGGGLSPQYAPMIKTLASAVAEEKGDFKYGIRVVDSINNSTIYDDDPWLHII
jgi:hypothetical protein